MMMDLPLISVIVPAYNASAWILDCCCSVYAQAYPNWELIVVDDGSSDNTLQLVLQEAEKNPNVKVIHTENGGVCRARNIGLEAAEGEFITFLDADDLLMPHALASLYELITTQGCDIAIGWKNEMRADGTEIGCPYHRERALWTGKMGLEMSLRDHPATYAVWGKLYRRTLVEDVRFTEGKRVHEDSFFLFQCFLKQPKAALTDACVLWYRISANSASRSTFSEKFFDILYFAEQKKALIETQYPEYRDLACNMLVKAHMAMLYNLCNTASRQYRQAEKDSIRAIIQNKAFFVPAIRADQKRFWIITHHLYGVYKFLYRIRHALR